MCAKTASCEHRSTHNVLLLLLLFYVLNSHSDAVHLLYKAKIIRYSVTETFSRVRYHQIVTLFVTWSENWQNYVLNLRWEPNTPHRRSRWTPIGIFLPKCWQLKLWRTLTDALDRVYCSYLNKSLLCSPRFLFCQFGGGVFLVPDCTASRSEYRYSLQWPGGGANINLSNEHVTSHTPTMCYSLPGVAFIVRRLCVMSSYTI